MLTKRRVRLLVIVLAVTALCVPLRAYGYQTFNDHRLTYGVTNQRFWLDASAVNNNEQAIVDGTALWNASPATQISYSRTATKSASRMDFYFYDNANVNYCAITYWYIDVNQVDPDSTNWWYGRVYTTPLLKMPNRCGDAGHRKAITAHEQGHVMGLAHAVNSDRLMYTYIAGTNVNAPSSDDVAGINHLY